MSALLGQDEGASREVVASAREALVDLYLTRFTQMLRMERDAYGRDSFVAASGIDLEQLEGEVAEARQRMKGA